MDVNKMEKKIHILKEEYIPDHHYKKEELGPLEVMGKSISEIRGEEGI